MNNTFLRLISAMSGPKNNSDFKIWGRILKLLCFWQQRQHINLNVLNKHDIQKALLSKKIKGNLVKKNKKKKLKNNSHKCDCLDVFKVVQKSIAFNANIN